MLSLIDFLKQADLDVYHDFDLRLRQMLEQARTLSGSKVRVAGHIMSGDPQTAHRDSNVLELVPLFSDRGLHSIPIVDDGGKLCVVDAVRSYCGVVPDAEKSVAHLATKFVDANDTP